jgi:hypothetical protein
MAFDLSFGSLASARDRLTRMRDDSMDSGATKAIKTGILSAETVGSALAFAWLQARFEKSMPQLAAPLGIPIDLLAGGALTAAAILLPIAGVNVEDFEPHMAAVGAGALSVYAAKFGVDKGAASAAKANASAMSAIATTPTTAAKGLVAGAPAFVAHSGAAAPVRRYW